MRIHVPKVMNYNAASSEWFEYVTLYAYNFLVQNPSFWYKSDLMQAGLTDFIV